MPYAGPNRRDRGSGLVDVGFAEAQRIVDAGGDPRLLDAMRSMARQVAALKEANEGAVASTRPRKKAPKPKGKIAKAVTGMTFGGAFAGVAAVGGPIIQGIYGVYLNWLRKVGAHNLDQEFWAAEDTRWMITHGVLASVALAVLAVHHPRQTLEWASMIAVAMFLLAVLFNWQSITRSF